MPSSSDAFTTTPRTRAEHLAVVLTLAGPLGPFNSPEDFEKLRETIYRGLDDEAFEGLLELVERGPDVAERAFTDEDDVITVMGHCLGTALEGRDDRWARIYPLLQDPTHREIPYSAVFWLGSPVPIPWLESQLARPDLSATDREDWEGLLYVLRCRNGLPTPSL